MGGVGSDPWVRFGARVRVAREKAGVSPEEVTEHSLFSVRTLGLIEEGSHVPDLGAAIVLDEKLEAEGVLLDAWAQTRITTSLQAGADIFALTEQVNQMRYYAPLVLPDPFLTEEYARALNRVERPMETRLVIRDRPRVRRVSSTSYGPPFHCLVVDEAALARVVSDARTTHDQLRHLCKLAASETVIVQVVPDGLPHHPGLRGASWTLSFSPRHTLAYTPHPRGPGHTVTDAKQIKGDTDLFATLQSVALSAQASLRLIEEAAKRFEEPPKRQAITAGSGTGGTHSLITEPAASRNR
ncbi:helix-turn-helix domain-containing protein [Nocardiopsis sp. NPDC055824]